MTILVSYFFLFIYCFYGITFYPFNWQTVLSFLCAVTGCALLYFFQNRTFSLIFLCIYAIILLPCPSMMLFCPVLFWEIGYRKLYPPAVLFGIVFLLLCFPKHITFLLYLIFGSSLACLLALLFRQHELLTKKYRQIRDDSVEKNLLLKARNQTLLENQDYDIHNATLQERNRIAREIHDNVGHILSRCILLTGALKAMNQDKNCTDAITTLQDNLSQAMDNIRTSVHNLHDDSINLEKHVHQLIDQFTYCDTRLDYDIQTELPSTVRYAFIAILKEALTNISKHSNATLVSVTLREHPAMYQLIIADNGTTANSASFAPTDFPSARAGIGLTNMSDRVHMLHGILQITTKKGFQIFVSIPKNTEVKAKTAL